MQKECELLCPEGRLWKIIFSRDGHNYISYVTCFSALPCYPQDEPPKHLALKANRACIHEIYKTIVNEETVLKGLTQTHCGYPSEHRAEAVD